MTEWEVTIKRSDGYGYKTITVHDCVTRNEAITEAENVTGGEAVAAKPVHTFHRSDYQDNDNSDSVDGTSVLALLALIVAAYIFISAWWIFLIIGGISFVIWILN